MGDKLIRYIIEGLDADDGHLRFGTLLNRLQVLSAALKQVDRVVSGKKSPTAYYRVVELGHSSPAQIALKPEPRKREVDFTEQIADRFGQTLEQIHKNTVVSEIMDRRALQAIRNLAQPKEKEFKNAVVATDDYEAPLDAVMVANIDSLLAPEFSTLGSIEGKLEQINLHNDLNQFRIYPLIGPDVVLCRFPRNLREKAIESVDTFVRVRGTLKYRGRERFPYRVDVKEMIAYPPDETLPHLFDLRGIAPDITGDKSSEDFVRGLRDEW